MGSLNKPSLQLITSCFKHSSSGLKQLFTFSLIFSRLSNFTSFPPMYLSISFYSLKHIISLHQLSTMYMDQLLWQVNSSVLSYQRVYLRVLDHYYIADRLWSPQSLWGKATLAWTCLSCHLLSKNNKVPEVKIVPENTCECFKMSLPIVQEVFFIAIWHITTTSSLDFCAYWA